MRQWKFRAQFASKKRKLEPVKDAQINSFDDVINDPKVLKTLSADAQLLWKVHGGDKSYAKSFWIGKSDEPQCLMEKFALQVGEWHSWDREDGFLGAEYWVQLRQGVYGESDEKHGLDFHFDKDEVSAKESDRWSHPAFSTVTYVDCENPEYPAGGVPLVIYETHSEGKSAVFPPRAWVVNPVPNRHVVFDGDLLHGCPSDMVDQILGTSSSPADNASKNKGIKYSRLAIAVNIWTSRVPKNTQRLDLSTLYPAAAKTNKKSSTTTAAPTVPVADIELNASDKSFVRNVTINSEYSSDINDFYFVTEHREGDTAPLPLREIKTEFLAFVENKGVIRNQDEIGSIIAVTYSAV